MLNNKSNDDIKVSVYCLTYNHEKYIKRCLDGFVMQKTDFKFEVFVHDDASTDNTAKIVKEYGEKYPDIIKPIYQRENQYSKGIEITSAYIFPHLSGKYIALCEGDDYWIDEKKLQKQYDFMENNVEYSACIHRAKYHVMDKQKKDWVVPSINKSRDISLEEIIMKDGGFFATNSLFRRREIVFSQPDCFNAKGFGDYQAGIYAAICGKVFCMEDVMSVYNVGTSGSWTERVWNNPQKRIEHLYDKIRMLKSVDVYYNQKYHDIISQKVIECEYDIIIAENNTDKLKLKPYCDIHKRKKYLIVKSRFLLGVKKLFPWIIIIKQRLKRKDNG